MLDSLRSRLILLLLGMLTFMTVAMGFAALGAMQRDSAAQARQALDVASRVFQEALSNRATQLGNSVRLVASDFGFRQAVALREQDTISSVLENHGSRIDATLTVLLTPQGELIASSGQDVSAEQITQLFKDMRLSGQDSVSDIVHIGHNAYQMVMVPVKAPQLIAWVAMGFALDPALAGQIKALTDLDISFVFGRGTAGAELLASTLTTAQQMDLTSAPAPTALKVLDQPILTTERPLDRAGTISALLHLSTAPWQETYQQARTQLLAIFGLGLTLAVLFAVALARSITKPLQLLTQFARAIGLGQALQAPSIKRGEVGLLSETLQKMQQDIRQREQQILFQAQHDTLTGLANRHLVELQLPTLLNSQPLWLLLINIKDFKHVNDAFGYKNGDSLLVQLSERLVKARPVASMIARLGGDEFLLVSPTTIQQQDLPALQQLLSYDFTLDNSRLNLKLALALYQAPAPAAASAGTANDALRRAEIAMVHAKTSHQLIAEYQPGQDESHQRELTLLHDLPLSLQSGHMFVVYQPKVSLRGRSAQSAEALIRWQHPQLGFVPPDEFIRLAEHSGLISRVTDWMIVQVIDQLAAWRRQGIELTVAVNLSAYDLLSSDLPGQIAALLAQHQLPASALALEVTEGAVMQDPEQVIQNLQTLREMGIELAIDDFGTGQSSLAYLKRLPVHEVKIDRAFVKDIEHNHNDALIVQTTTELAHGLGLLVTAEGLENLAGLAKLQAAGIDKVQGYYFAKPLKAADLTGWLIEFQQNNDKWFPEVS
ncbi:EAL domain-containing protein [Rheinheimera sp.]|uniref:bifunctional diguanylate cyclase/phosphodiesterase n=1 Tax=Rheinheimera sp. TaxID=1869214 RepID=UPI003D2CF314